MNRYIKIQLLKDGKPLSSTLYTYKTSINVQLGEVVQATEKLQGVVAGFEVISNISQPEKIKEIVGQINKSPLPLDEIEGYEELCKHCAWTKGEIDHRCDAVCEGSYCDSAYDRYLEDFEEENGGKE